MAKALDGVLTERLLEDTAGGTVAGNGAGLVGAVRGLRVEAGGARGSVQGQRPYSVQIRWSKDGVDGECACRVADQGQFCQHMVAVALAALDASPISGPCAPGSVPEEPTVESYLRTLDAGRLRSLVMETAAFSEAALRHLEVQAALATGDTSAIGHELLAATNDALWIDDDYVDYERSYAVAGRAESVLDELETHLDDGAASVVLPALLQAASRLREIGLDVDDWSGSIGEAGQRAVKLYARACREGSPDPVELATWLVAFRADSPGWPDVALTDFVDAFDDAAMRTYRAAVASLAAQRQDIDHRHRHTVDQMLLELADHDGDVDRAIDLLQQGEHLQYGAIVQRLLAVDRRAEAITFIDRAVAGDRVAVQSGNTSFLSAAEVAQMYAEDGRTADALALLRGLFDRQPRASTYSLLCRFADEFGQGDAERKAALASAERLAAQRGSGDLLIELALHDNDLDRAWAAVDEYGPGLGWISLANASAQTMPERVLDLYRWAVTDQLRTTDRRTYRFVAETLIAMRGLAKRLGALATVDGEIRAIREQYRRRPAMMEILNRHGLPR